MKAQSIGVSILCISGGKNKFNNALENTRGYDTIFVLLKAVAFLCEGWVEEQPFFSLLVFLSVAKLHETTEELKRSA